MSADVTVYAAGLCHASACAPKGTPVAEIERAANSAHPTGLDHGWRKSDNDTFSGGEPNPCACNDDPDRLHWLLEC